MVETYFAIRLYALYTMLIALGICVIILFIIWIKKR